nr:hypothetical protein [Haliscomenobacter sp.]
MWPVHHAAGGIKIRSIRVISVPINPEQGKILFITAKISTLR